MKHYSLKDLRHPVKPALLFEVKIDLQDVRSGYRGSESGLFKGDWLTDQRYLVWTKDMVSRLNPEQLQVITPPLELEWPEGGDETIITYLLRHYRPRIWKNYHLRVYSGPTESREDFIERCRETLNQQRSIEMKKLREVFMHRFFELEQRLVRFVSEEDTNEELKMERQAAITALFCEAREELSRCFVRDDYQLLGKDDLVWSLASNPECQDRLDNLRMDLISLFNEVSSRYEESAIRVEAYEVTARRPGIEIVSRSFLWE